MNPIKQTLESQGRIIKSLIFIGAVFILAACTSIQPPKSNNSTDFYYVASVDIAASAKQSNIEKTYGGKAIVFKPEAGFAVLGFSKEAGELTTLATDLNQDVLETPAANAQGYEAWAGGYAAWAGGYNAWANGYAAWAGGYAAWASGHLAWAGGTASIPELPSENRLHFNLMKLPQGQAIARNFGNEVKVAVLDTGIDLNHPMFAGRLAPANEWKDFVDNDTIPQEVNGTFYGHGTGVAGLVVQVAPAATILPLRVLGANGSGDVDHIISAIDWAIQKGAKVINMSLGTTTNVAAFQAMIDYATSQGVYITASAGNSGDSNVTYPAAWAKSVDNSKYILSVGSVSDAYVLSTFSCSNSTLEFVAPGELITSAYPDTRIATYTGTSFAAPLVAGTLALGLSDSASNYHENLEAYLEIIGNTLPFTSFKLVNVSGFLQQAPDFQPRKALFVVGSTSLHSADTAIKQRLESLGYAVTIEDDNLTSSADADGKNLVLISSSVSGSTVNSKFKDISVPVINWEDEIHDDMKMTSATRGDISEQTKIAIMGKHPLTASLSGTITVYSSKDRLAYGSPGSSAIIVGRVPSDSSKAVIFGYDIGATMVGINAPSRRVGMFFQNASDRVTAQGWQLFEAAVTWAVTGN